jgi:DNA mismatch endonuclease, patch repair protein
MAEGNRRPKDTGSTDVLTRAERSYCMSRIRSRDTKPEVMLRRTLWQRGLRYRIHNDLPGRPDIVFPSRKIVIFVDGCFWHRCPQHWKAPKNNAEFWEQKIRGNQIRDARVNRELEEAGWQVIRVWEHDVRKGLETTADKLMASIRSAQH